jgi:hypothetical protein
MSVILLNVISVSFIQFKVILASVILLLEPLLLSVHCTVTLFFSECHSAHFMIFYAILTDVILSQVSVVIC